MADQPVTLPDFVEEMENDLHAFRDWYVNQAAKARQTHAEEWPYEMGSGDWYEQFISWQQLPHRGES